MVFLVAFLLEGCIVGPEPLSGSKVVLLTEPQMYCRDPGGISPGPGMTERIFAKCDKKTGDPYAISFPGATTFVRIRLPELNLANAAVRMFRHPCYMRAYINDKQVYVYSGPEGFHPGQFHGWTEHIIDLQGRGGGIVLLEMFCEQRSQLITDTYGDQHSVLAERVRSSLEYFAIAVLGLFFGVLSLGVFLFRRDALFATLGACYMTIGFFLLLSSYLGEMMFRNFSFRPTAEYLSMYGIPAAVLAFSDLGKLTRKFQKLARVLWIAFGAYGPLAVILDQTGILALSRTLLPFQLALLPTSLLFLGIITYEAVQSNREAQVLALGIGLMSITGLHATLNAMGAISGRWYFNYGLLAFFLGAAGVAVVRIRGIYTMVQGYSIELEGNNKRLQELDRLKDEFLTNTSHELRTPLNGIIGLAESLKDGIAGPLNQTAYENINMIVASGKRLSFLVNDILDFSKLKNHEIILQTSTIDLHNISELVLKLAKSLIGQKQIDLVLKIDPDIRVKADENRLQQILLNLVSNAIKFTKQGSITLLAERQGDFIAVTVADTGIGIPAEKHSAIFESFEQADGSTAREFGGTGIGLTITKQLVELHGGTIKVDSAPGQGARFTFAIPAVAKESNEYEIQNVPEESEKLRSVTVDKIVRDAKSPGRITDIPVEEEQRITLKDRREKLIETDGHDIKVLAVDDEPVNLQVLKNYLTLAGIQTELAGTGSEALEKIRAGYRPDIVLLDIMMPGLSGFDTCQKLRENFSTGELPVIMLTAKSQVSDLVEGFSAGANDYITKPFSKNELFARLKTHFGLSQINLAASRFVPSEFLNQLGRQSIIDIHLGDHVEKEMSIFFSDIRDFTSLSEKMTPKENFDFINSFLGRTAPVIADHNGFIDKFIGDAIMALFPKSAEDALKAAIEMTKLLKEYNKRRAENGKVELRIGIGIHTGNLMLGTVGSENRMDGTVISDAVNLASRLESLTKMYGATLVISEKTFSQLSDPTIYNYRILDHVKVKGKKDSVSVFEMFDADPDDQKELKKETRHDFELGLFHFMDNDFEKSNGFFQATFDKNPADKAAALYLKRCEYYAKHGLPHDWQGVTIM